jgi:uncharacterized protein YbjQ (UPF0145 family)
MPMVTEDLIKGFRVMFYCGFDVMSDVRSNDFFELFGGYVKIFVFDEIFELFGFSFCFLD